jgi:type II secretory pathway predicted ATPase ExeA
MQLDYFGFRRNPFGSTPDSRGIFLSGTHRDALESLRSSYVSNRGFTALIAPPGMGKTTLLFRFLDQIRFTSKSVFLFDVDHEFTPRELAAYVLRDMDLEVPSTAVEMYDLFKQVLATEAQAGRKFVLVIDEAQNLSEAALETVRLMSNFETAQAKLMQIVLAGHPQLAETLSRPSLVQFRQRISFMCRIDPLSNQETRAYINQRISFAGYSGGGLFTDRALDLIIQAAQGTPRIINMICFSSLSICCALRKRQVDEAMVREVINDQRLGLAPTEEVLRSTPVISTPQPPPQQPAPFLADPAASPKRVPRVGVWKSFVTAAALLVLAGGVGVGVYRVFGVGGNLISSAPHEDSTQPSNAPFAVRVQPNQSIGSIAKQYLGSFDEERLQQIKALNPWLTNPDRIQAGQELLLPGPRPTEGESPVNDSVTNGKAK